LSAEQALANHACFLGPTQRNCTWLIKESVLPVSCQQKLLLCGKLKSSKCKMLGWLNL